MDIIGAKVIHKLFGEGIITNFNDDFFTVDFMSEKKTFLFPQAFSQGIIEGIDESSNYVINCTIKDRKCVICGACDQTTQIIDNKRYCKKCQKEYSQQCLFCKEFHDKSSFVFINDYDYH